MSRIVVPVATLILCLLTSPAAAQQPLGAVRGFVTDASGAAVPEVEARLRNTGTNAQRTVQTTGDGEYVIAALPPGRYELELVKPGFRTHVASFELHVNQNLRLDVVLEAGGPTERVVVSGTGEGLDREEAGTRTVIDNRQVELLPLDGRNVLELTLLVPGTAPAAEGSASSVRGDFAFTVSGGREDTNGFLLDGVDNVDPKLNTPAVRPPVDAIKEFEVQTSGYEAATGRYSAGQVSVVSHSGTNALRGTAYGFFRSEALDATHVFALREGPEPEYSRRQFGGSIGGPLLRDRLFFFADYEGTRIKEGITRVTNVPTEAERRGDFSSSLLPPPINFLTGEPFPGGRLPEFMLNPIGVAIANLYPLPNRDVPGANFVSSPSLDDRNDQFDVRIDRPVGDRLDLMARYSFADRTMYEPFAGPAFTQVPGFGNTLERRAQNAVVSALSVLSPRLLNEARFGYTRVSAAVNQEGQGVSLNRQLGLPELSSNPRDWGLSFITVSGFSPLGHEYNNPQHGTTDAFQVTDTVTWSAGRHLVKAGFDLRAIRQDAFRDVQARGNIAFTPFAYTGNALADLLLGLPTLTVGATTLDNPQRLRTENVGLFVQDSWRVRPDLTLTAGLRYELTSPPVDRDDRATLYVPELGALQQVGTGGLPRAGYATDRNNFAPRVAVAWSAMPRTVVRGAYGIYYNQSALAPSEGLYFSDPYFHLGFFVPAQGLPPLTLFDPFPADYPVPSPQSGFAIQRDLRTPYLQHVTAGVQRQIGRASTVEAAYVGTRGSNLHVARDINQPRPSPAPVNLRPNPLFGDITMVESVGRSRYHALQLRYEERSLPGLSLLASYTLGRSEDDASGFFPSAGDPNFPQDSENRAAEYGRSSYDVRHRFSLAFVWELPYESSGGIAGALLSDWQLSGVVTLQSGRPFTVALLPEIDNSNTGRSNLGFGANDRPNVVGDPRLDNPTPERWFDTSAFVMPPFGTFGNSGRNTLEGPGYRNVNLALIRWLPLGAGARLQLRAEAFNVFNRANYDNPDAFFGSPTFGRIVSAQPPRRIQLGAKVVF